MSDGVAKPAAGESLSKMPFPGMVDNLGPPILFKDVENIAGYSLNAAQEGDGVQICCAKALTSDEPIFHRIADSMADVIDHLARASGVGGNVRRADTTLFVIRDDGTAELWLDTAAEAVHAFVKRDFQAGMAVLETDIADILTMSFPCVRIGPTDKVFCIFRVGWRFGMAFDFNRDGQLDLESFQRSLGWLLRNLKYRNLYDSLGDKAIFSRLIASGWFPFAEIISREFKEILSHIEAGFETAKLEESILANFNEERMRCLVTRWVAKPHLSARKDLLKAAVDAFNRKEPIAVIKILVTEIEGILNDAYRQVNDGKGAKTKKLLQFAMESAEQKTGGSDTLMFPKAFAEYLAQQTFANFDPEAGTGTASSRHAVGHGAAPQETYTMVRALQVILTLDQLVFYT
ncbi:hypothetical protein ACOTHZ_11265 [Achromobacter xylosoxidans]